MLGLVNDLDLRKLRYFLAVVEHLNFARAAQALHIAQPVLSRQIKALEHELDAQLLTRDRRGTELTDAGRQLATDASEILAAAQGLRRRVTRAAHGGATFVIGFMPGLTVTDPVRALGDPSGPKGRRDPYRIGRADARVV
jgi:DNA-binding transcriptional LysR family regulator